MTEGSVSLKYKLILKFISFPYLKKHGDGRLRVLCSAGSSLQAGGCVLKPAVLEDTCSGQQHPPAAAQLAEGPAAPLERAFPSSFQPKVVVSGCCESLGLCTKQPAHGLVPFGGLWGVCWYCPHSRGWFVVGLEGASSP